MAISWSTGLVSCSCFCNCLLQSCTACILQRNHKCRHIVGTLNCTRLYSRLLQLRWKLPLSTKLRVQRTQWSSSERNKSEYRDLNILTFPIILFYFNEFPAFTTFEDVFNSLNNVCCIVLLKGVHRNEGVLGMNQSLLRNPSPVRKRSLIPNSITNILELRRCSYVCNHKI